MPLANGLSDNRPALRRERYTELARLSAASLFDHAEHVLGMGRVRAGLLAQRAPFGLCLRLTPHGAPGGNRTRSYRLRYRRAFPLGYAVQDRS